MMTRPADSPWPEIARQAWQDLQPFPGRFGMTWRVALLCAIVAAVAMILKIPEAAISCYLIIFLMKSDAVQNCLMGIGLILLATTVVAAMIPIINASIDSPAMRLAVMFVSSYVFLFLSSTTPLGEQAAIVGLIIAFIMTLVGDVPVGQIGNQGLLAAWKMASMPMALMIVFNLIFGIPSQTHVRNKISARLRAAAEFLARNDETRRYAYEELLSEGNDAPLQQMLLVKLLRLVPQPRSLWLNGAVETSYRILIALDAVADPIPEGRRAELAERLNAAATQIEAGNIPAQSEQVAAASNRPEQLLQSAIADLSRPDGGGSPQPRAMRILAVDAFSNPDHQRYALKTSIAAVLCYLIYTGIQWNGIHTAMITCYVAALGTTGETVRKLALRIVGCLIGAAMGAASLIYIMPHLTSIGGLMGLVFCGVLVGAWVSTGNERIYYAGVQIALAFLLTTLNGFWPSFEFSQASDRIWGILLGIFVIFVIFTQFWPRSVTKDVRLRLSAAMDALDILADTPKEDDRVRVEAVTACRISCAQATELLDAAPFEPGRLRASPEQIERLRSILDEVKDLSVHLYISGSEVSDSHARLRQLRVELADGDVSVQPEHYTAMA